MFRCPSMSVSTMFLFRFYREDYTGRSLLFTVNNTGACYHTIYISIFNNMNLILLSFLFMDLTFRFIQFPSNACSNTCVGVVYYAF